MNAPIRKFIRQMQRGAQRGLLGLGYQMIPNTPRFSGTSRLAAMLRYHRINQIFDVGANSGQFGMELRRSCRYRGEIISIEPLKSAYERLKLVAARDPIWHIAPRCALGTMDGDIEINVAANSASSSILPMLDTHVRAAPEAQYEKLEKVPIRRLDSIAPKYLRPDSIPFLKIDTQGYELNVIQGGLQTLARTRGLQIEMSIIPLYSGQILMNEMLAYVESAGFELWGLSPAFVDEASGRMLQADGVFFRIDPP